VKSFALGALFVVSATVIGPSVQAAQSKATCYQQCHYGYIACMEHKSGSAHPCGWYPSCRAQCESNQTACQSCCAGNCNQRERR